MVVGDRRLTVRLISDELGLNRNSVWQIITDLEIRKVRVCVKMVPHLGSSSTSSLPSLNVLCQRKAAERNEVCSL